MIVVALKFVDILTVAILIIFVIEIGLFFYYSGISVQLANISFRKENNQIPHGCYDSKIPSYC